MTPITRAQRLTNCQLYKELVHYTNDAELDDDTLAIIEEAAQRLVSKADKHATRLTVQTLHEKPSG